MYVYLKYFALLSHKTITYVCKCLDSVNISTRYLLNKNIFIIYKFNVFFHLFCSRVLRVLKEKTSKGGRVSKGSRKKKVPPL